MIKGILEDISYARRRNSGIMVIEDTQVLDIIQDAITKQLSEDAIVKYHKGDISALIICPMCSRSIIANIELYKESNDIWYCKDCGQKLTLRNFKE